MKTVFALAAAVACAFADPLHTRNEAIMSSENAVQSRHSEWLQRLTAADNQLFASNPAFSGSGFTGFGASGADTGISGLPSYLRQQPMLGSSFGEPKELKESKYFGYGSQPQPIMAGEQKWLGSMGHMGYTGQEAKFPISAPTGFGFGGQPQWQRLESLDESKLKEFQKLQELKSLDDAKLKEFQSFKEFKEMKEDVLKPQFSAIEAAELVPQSYTVGAITLDQATLMGQQAANNVPLPKPEPITANLQRLPATTKQALTAKQQTEQAITNQPIYQTYEQRVMQPLQQTVRQPVIQPVLQPVIQPIVQQAQPVVQPMVQRVVRPFVIRQVSPQLSTQVQKGAPLQPIVQEPMVTGQKSANAQQAITLAHSGSTNY